MNNHPYSHGSLATHIILTAIVAAALDAIGAMLVFNVPAVPMFKYIASGLLGPTAFEGGTGAAIFGMAIHLCIALCWTCFYFLLARGAALFRYNVVLIIILFGILIWIAMNLLVLPLTKVTLRGFDWIAAAKGSAILIVTVALPVVISANRFWRNHEREATSGS